MKTYAEAEAYLAGGRDPRRRRLPGKATEVHRIEGGRLTRESIHVMYHATDVVKYYPDKIVLNSGGYRTQTTKDRMNQYSPAHIYQSNGIWYICTRLGREHGTLFYDGMEIDNAGMPLAPVSCGQRIKLEEAKRKVDRLVSRYIAGFVNHLQYVGHVEDRGLGDCLQCTSYTSPAYGVDHLLMHLEEQYFVPSLLWNAINKAGYSNPRFIVGLINSDLRQGRSDLYHVKSSLRAYFRSRKLALAELIAARAGV